jgi:hypothetical protein
VRNMLRMSMTVTRMPARTRLCRAFVLRILSYDERRKNAIRLKAHAQASGSKPGLSQCHGQRRGRASRNPRDSFRRHPRYPSAASERGRLWRCAFPANNVGGARILYLSRWRERHIDGAANLLRKSRRWPDSSPLPLAGEVEAATAAEGERRMRERIRNRIAQSARAARRVRSNIATAM